MRFTIALTTILGATLASAAAVARGTGDGDANSGSGNGDNNGNGSSDDDGNSTGNVVDSGNVVNSGNTVDSGNTNTGNQCSQSHPVASCCNSSGAAGLLGFLDAGSLGCSFNVLPSDCNQQTYCCQDTGNVALINVGCVNLVL